MNRMNIRFDQIIMPVVGIVLGGYLVARPWSATGAICSLIGWLILLSGVAGIISAAAFRRATLLSDPFLPLSVAGAVLGLFIVTRPTILVEIVGMIICVFLLVEGVNSVQNAIQRHRWGDSLWWLPLIVGIVCLLLGLAALFAPVASTAMMMRLIGISLIVSGVVNLLALFVRTH